MNTTQQSDGTTTDTDSMTSALVTHPVGTASGVLGGAIAGAAIGTAVGPVGTALGAAIGAIAGGFAANAMAETMHPSTPEAAHAKPTAASANTVDHTMVAECAFYIWQNNGYSDGHDLDNWLQAEQSLHA